MICLGAAEVLGTILTVGGAALVLDELHLFGIPYGGFIGDLSEFHVEPFHHWMLGAVMVVAGLGLLLVGRKSYTVH